MFLKKSKNLIYLIILLLLTIKQSHSNNHYINEITQYLESIKSLSVSFIQNEDGQISEGVISIGENRLRVDYFSPTKFIIIVSKNKGMYYNIDLDEDEFFDPNNTSARFFFDIFHNPKFFFDGKVFRENASITLEKGGLTEDGNNYNIKLLFEDNPFNLKKIDLFFDVSNLSLSIFGHNYNPTFNKKHFKLINPSFFVD